MVWSRSMWQLFDPGGRSIFHDELESASGNVICCTFANVALTRKYVKSFGPRPSNFHRADRDLGGTNCRYDAITSTLDLECQF
jgi:hypothetical protein